MNNGVSFIPIGIGICYCYLTIRESNKVDIIKPWYELNSLESLAIIYCILIGTIRANWIFFMSLFKIGVIGFLVVFGWYLLYNLEEFKNMLILIIRQNSQIGESNHEADFDYTFINDLVSENEKANNCKPGIEITPENETPSQETIELLLENEMDESISELDKNLEILVPEIDKIIENISVDTKKLMDYVEQEKENNMKKVLSPEHKFSSDQLVTELERITDTLVRDTRKIADNVSFVSTMIFENSIPELSNISENENFSSIVTSNGSKSPQKGDNIEIHSEKNDFETKNDVSVKINKSNEYQKCELEEAVELISNTENIAETMITSIENFVEGMNQ